jgi:hypothetical protein
MSSVIDFGNIHQSIADNKRSFTPSDLRDSIKYLINAANTEGCWGIQKGAPTDIYLSALSIEAIKMSNEHEYDAILENAVSRLKVIIGSDAKTLNEDNLINILNINSDSQHNDKTIEKKIVSQLISLKQDNGWGKPEPSLILSCRTILAFIKIGELQNKISRDYVDYLVRYQNSEDGGWGTTQDSKSALIPTCFALRVLTNYNDKASSNARSKGANFLIGYLDQSTWKNIEDTYVIANILKAIGNIEEIPYKIIKEGVEALYGKRNSDGGWGLTKKGSPSGIEATALSISALISAGENSFISASLVEEIIDSIENETGNLQNEFKELSTAIDQKVEGKIGSIIKEKNDCLKEKENLIGELDKLKNETINIVKDRDGIKNILADFEGKIKDREDRINELQKIINNQQKDINNYSDKIKSFEENVLKRLIHSDILLYVIALSIIAIALSGIIYFIYISYNYLSSNYQESFVFIKTNYIYIFESLFAYIFLFIILYIGIKMRAEIRDIRFMIISHNDLSRFEETTDYRVILYRLASIMDLWPPSKRGYFISRLQEEDFNSEYLAMRFSDNSDEQRQLEDVLHKLQRLEFMNPKIKRSIINELQEQETSSILHIR